jgi:DDE superfamily endonuclease
MVLKTGDTWPLFASLEECTKLRKEEWHESYGHARIIMWDMTDIPMFKPSDLHSQRLTYSAYYGGNCGKGSVFLQPCGWLGSYEMWMGAVSDTEYLKKSGILTVHQTYRQIHDNGYPNAPWHILLDKGFRVNIEAFKEGGQMVVQPAFASADRRFRASETIQIADVAHDRSGNERGVRVMKYSGYIKHGLHQGGRAERLCKVWLAWGFQANFMYRPVL